MTDSRHRILAEATDLFLSEGMRGVTMRSIARRVGMTAPALYRHFQSREEILTGVALEAHRLFGRHLFEALSGETPEERMQRAAAGYLEFALGNRRFHDIVHRSREIFGGGPPAPEVESAIMAAGRFWEDRVRECMDAGILRSGDAASVSTTLWAHAHGLVSLYFSGALDLDEASFRALFWESALRIFRGLAVPAWTPASPPGVLSASSPPFIHAGVRDF